MLHLCAASACAIAVGLASLPLAGCSNSKGAGASAEMRTVTDMAGRKVKIPVSVHRIVTVGSVPVINSFPFAVGAGAEIVNGIPGANASGYRSYRVFAPRLLSAPTVESVIGGPVNKEALLQLKPDVVLTENRSLADQIQPDGIPVVVINLESGPNIEQAVRLTGEVLGRSTAAADYVGYFDGVVHQVRAVAAGIPTAQRPTVLYIDLKPLRRPNRIMEWMLDQVGARSVTHSVSIGQYLFPVEQLLKWNPQVLIGMEPYDRTGLLGDPRFRSLQAVRSGRIAIIPTGIQIWGNNTSEQPLGLLWVANHVYPRQFASIDMTAQTKAFYQRFFHVDLTGAQVEQVLSNRF